MRSVLRRPALVAVVVVSFLLAGGAVSRADQKPPALKTTPKVSAQKATPKAGAPYWKCSMDPDVESPTPGTCPKCGMALTKVNADGTPFKATAKSAAAEAKARTAKAGKPGTATLALHTDPQPLQVGPTDFMVMVKDAHHELVADANVTLVMTLPRTPSDPATRIEIPMAAAEHGIYRGSGRVPKMGPWTFTVEAKRAGKSLATLTDMRMADR